MSPVLIVFRFLGPALPLAFIVGMGALVWTPSTSEAAAPAFLPPPLEGQTPRRDAPRSREPESTRVSPRKVRMAGPASVGFSKRREARQQPTASPRLKPGGPESLSELTKPAYLLVRLLATPTNHRAPPA